MKARTFLDDDYVPADPVAFQAGQEAERARRDSPEEQARVQAAIDELAAKIAAGFKQTLGGAS